MAVERKFIKEAVNRVLVRDFVQKETERAGYGGMEIQRTPLGTRVNIVAERPGMVIGRRGATINELTSKLQSQFGIENPQISVEEPNYNPGLNAQIMAIKVAESLERGWHFRRVGHSTTQRVMASGAQGVIVEIAGKLTGQRKRREKFIAGHVKYCGETALTLMDVGYAQCKKKLGIIGCTVRIMKKDAHLPDEVKVFAPGEKDAAEAAAKARAQAQAAGVQTVTQSDFGGAGAAGASPQTGTPSPAPASTQAPRPANEPRTPAPSTGPAPAPGRRERKSFTVGGQGGSQ